jgi:stage III sporulation protein AD
MAGAVVGYVRELGGSAGISGPAVSIVLKEVGVSVVTRLAAAICRESGQSAAASGAEFVGAVTAVYIALPLFKTVMSMIENLL